MSYRCLIIHALISYTCSLVIHENVIFHKTNEVSSNHARWLVTFIHDLRLFDIFIDKINDDLKITKQITKSLTNWYRQENLTGYVFTFESLHDEIALLNDTYQAIKNNFDDYQSLRSGNYRPKRSLLPIIGQAMSLLFGTISESDLENIQTSIKNLAKNQISIIHNLDQSMTLLNLSRFQIAENRRAIIDVVKCVQSLDRKIIELKEAFQEKFARLEQFVNTNFQLKLILEEIRQTTQNAVLYLENLRAELNMLSLNHLSPSTITPNNLRGLLLEISDKLPTSMRLAADPILDIWYFYNTLTCTAYLDGYKILIVLSIPLVDRRESFDVYKIHNLPLSIHNSTPAENTNVNMVAKYNLETEAFMVNTDRTKYALLTKDEISMCNNKYMTFCNPKSAIYQTNLSKTCIIALFLKHTENIKQYCRSTVYFDTILPVAQYIYSGMWVVATHQPMKFTIVCTDPPNPPGYTKIQPPLGVIRLNMSCRASNNYLSLPPFYENKIESHMQDSWRSLLKLRAFTKFTLWDNISSTFPNITSLRIPDNLRNLKQIPMPSLINFAHGYKTINVSGGRMSIWIYVIIGFSTVMVIILALFVYLKCIKNRKQNRFIPGLANCCNDEKAVAGQTTVTEVVSATSQTDEVVSHKPGGRFFSTPDLKEAGMSMASLIKGTET